MPSNIKPSVWDDSDPDYAPFLKYTSGAYRWIPSIRYKKAGYDKGTVRLDAQEPQFHRQRAAQCRSLTRDLLTWFESLGDGYYQGREPGTWGWLIARYLHDEHSHFNRLEDPTTKSGYGKHIRRIEKAIGEIRIEDTDHAKMMGWVTGMEKNSRSPAYISKWFTHFMFVVKHGIALENDRCLKIRDIRSAMQLGGQSRERAEYITPGQYEALLQGADERAETALALAIALRYETGLRGTDIYGEWIKGEGGIYTHRGKTWTKGLRWEMFDRDMNRLEVTPWKTRKKMSRPLSFPISDVPDLRRRLLTARGNKVSGAVILHDATGRPPGDGWFSRRFKWLLSELGMPASLQIRDLRAGAATEADIAGADQTKIQRMMGHRNILTTQRYIREDQLGQVIEMRQDSRRKNVK